MSELEHQIRELCSKAKAASRALAPLSADQKNQLLMEIAEALVRAQDAIAAANDQDLTAGQNSGLSAALLDRLHLNERRFQQMVTGVRQVVALKDPVGEVIQTWVPENGIEMQKVRTPIGTIGIIYESRPNVTVDAGVLCLKSGNVPVLRGGKEAFHTNLALVEVMQGVAEKMELPREIVSFLPTIEREAIPLFCRQETIDLMIPRGGHGLIKTVVEHARMPVIKHYHGVCHIYVHQEADLEMAEKVIINAKTQRPGVCNAVETVLVDESIASQFLPQLVTALQGKGVTVLGDETTSTAAGCALDAPENWEVEYLDLILAIRVVSGLDEALHHLNDYGSHHTDTIITEDETTAEEFLNKVDSATVFWNASTRFADGGQFGFGAEIGISTDKIHARGPMALEELTIYKYIGRGTGQTRH
ncbi:MAG: glutamate-5-semialdehyde dehydrogenase [Verrucomicrobiota bacterium]